VSLLRRLLLLLGWPSVEASVILRGTRSRGYGFVTMSSEAEAQKAVDTISGREIQEREINVEIAKPRVEG
jgi:RNA recognition motif-containing protein